MLSRTRCWLSVLLLVNVATSWAVERSDEQQEMLPLGQIQNHFDLADGDGSVEAALLNYLYAKQIVERLMNGRDVVELQRKRAYWKQCAFNAVSCFGRKPKMHFYKLDADLIYQIYRNYKKWILENPTKSQELEMAIKWGSYLIAGRFQNASLLCEITYAGSRLLEMFNNSILSGKLPQLTFAQYDRLKLLLTIVEYIEVLIEMIAVQIWGETGRWAVIALIQLTKAIWKMVLLFKHKMILIGSPAVKPVNRLEVLKERKQTSLMNGFSSPKRVTRLPRSGRLMRTLDGSAPHHIRSFSPPFELVASNSDDQLYCKTHLPINMLTAEVLHICRPIGHLTSMYLFGVKSWVPWCFALGIDFTSLGLYNNCVLTKEERSELACRRFSLLLYLIRTPAFHAVTHRRINQFLIAASDKIPFARFICQPLLEYVPEWQNMYSYTWS